MIASPALAQDTSGCAVLGNTAVTLSEAGQAAHSTGAVPLRAGEMLQLRMTSDGPDGAAGSIAVTENGETDAPVVSGAAPQQTVFTAPYDGLFGLEFRASGTAPVNFSVSCDSQSADLAPSTSPEAFVNRRAARTMAEDTDQASLRRRDAKPATLDKAVKTNTVLGEDGEADRVSVATSIQSLAAAEGQKFADDKLDVWVEGRVAKFEQKFDDNGRRYQADGAASTVNLGTDYVIRPGLMVGALVQLDQYHEAYDGLGGATASHGVLAGPYASIRLAPDLVFDARAAWGTSENESDLPDGGHAAFDTERQLLRGKLSGNRDLFGLQFTPSIALAVVEDGIGYVHSSDQVDVEQQNAALGRLGVGSTLSRRFPTDDGGFVQPSAGLSTGWTLDQLDGFAFEDTQLVNESGVKAEAGVALGTADGVNISATGAVEGIGEEDFSAWSGRVMLKAPLN
jgi:VCBS repeat-containing protein